jgi:5-formyltetrahydrofolate cyclo-ligase
MDKKDLRRQYLVQRMAIPETERSAKDRAIMRHLKQFIEQKNFTKVFLYQAFRGEPNLSPIMAEQLGLIFALPVSDFATRTMQFRQVRAGDTLVKSKFDLFEPAKDDAKHPVVTTDSSSLILVPALAVDLKGYRLGYGAGFYDRFLAQARGASVCVVYAPFLVSELPADTHDHPVRYTVTEDGLNMSRNY